MDSNCSVMGYGMEEECFEEQDYTTFLTNDVLLFILSELPWRDILNVKLLSRRFYGIIHDNYLRLQRRKGS
uniref:F-box domain-containing protein n=1 Tax=Strongyloides venezuelensis TaxID=75913 RepID=A0A0K0FVK9_STRVS